MSGEHRHAHPHLLGPALGCLAAAALFGAATPASKLALANLGPLTLAGLLYLGAALAVLAPAVRAGRPARLGGPALARIGAAIVCGGALAPVLLLFALRRAGAADVSLWLALETVFTGVLARLFFREHLSARAWLANGAIFGAGALLAAPHTLAGGTGALLVAGACLLWAVDNNLTAVVTELSPAQLTAAKGLFAGAVNLALGFALERPPLDARLLPGLVIGALGYGASLVLYIRAARALGAARSQMLFATAPFFGAALAFALLGEPLRALQLAAGLLLALGLWLLYRERHGHAHVHEPLTHTHEHTHDDAHHDHAHPGLPPGTRHSHPHAHAQVEHSHPHVPDLHHRHEH